MDTELLQALEQMNSAFDAFKKSNEAKHKKNQQQIDELAKILGRPGAVRNGGSGETPEDQEHKAAFVKYLRRGDASDLRETKEMVVGSDPAGGYLVDRNLAASIFRVMGETSPIREISRNVQLGSAAYEEPQDRGADADCAWVGEMEDRPETATPELGLLSIPAHEIYAMPAISQKLLDDNVFKAEDWLVKKLGEAFGNKAGQGYVSGDGVKKPRGFATYPTVATVDATRAWGKFQHIPTGNSGGFATSNPGDALVDVSLSLRPQYLARARWLMSRATAAAIRKFKDGQGQYLWQNGSIESGQPPMLLGYPVTLDENVSAISANSLSVWFGDFSAGYTVADRKEITTLRDPYTRKGFVRFYSMLRTGGDVSDFNALKTLKFATS